MKAFCPFQALLDVGRDLNAFYTRGGAGDLPGLNFFSQTVNGVEYFSGESPEVVCHEFGHAVLDALKPELWDAAFIETSAFHESFADISSILSVLQLESVRASLIASTNGKLYQASRVSRLAEQLGFAIRQLFPDAVESDCLRNAVNSFFYSDPQNLPPSAPASQLCSEPHSFSRVFTSAFFEVLAGAFEIEGGAGDSASLLGATTKTATLLLAAIKAATVVPAFYSQVAAEMIALDAADGARYRDVLKAAFSRRGILSLTAATSALVTPAAPPPTVKGEVGLAAPSFSVGRMALSSTSYGLDKSLIVFAPGNAPRFSVSGAAASIGGLETPSREYAAKSHAEDLFRRGNVAIDDLGDPGLRVSAQGSNKTHYLVAVEDGFELRRRTFDCGLSRGR